MPIIKDNVGTLFSCLSGYNFYQLNRGCSLSDMEIHAVHCLSESGVEIRKTTTQLNPGELKKWKYFVEHPVNVTNMLWPIDIVSLNDDLDIGLVFRARALPKMEPLKTILYNEDELDWRNPHIQDLVISFLKQCIDIHKNGYAYHSFDINRMFYNVASMEAFFDFSLSITPAQEVTAINSNDVGIEFLPPWCDIEGDNPMGLAEDYYSIAAILFRLMIGRMPYQGRLMDGKGNMMNHLTDVDEDFHVMMFKAYHSTPVFVFDKNNTSNSIGLYTVEEKFVERWEKLPEKIKKMFSETLIYSENIRSKVYSDNGWLEAHGKIYSGYEWLEALKSNCFGNKGD